MELVCPAGNIEKLRYAYEYGADAAYIGLKNFSLRVKADNFHDEEYIAIRNLKNNHPNKRLFCAMNITFHNKDLDAFLGEIDYFKQYPFDAFIVQDIGMVNLIQKHFPQAKLHLSTQANCINREAVKMYKSLGFERVVVGREASLAEIREIKDAVPDMEIEAFGHGAMCIAYSGRCLMSAYMNGRSANAGACSHSCRWDFDIKTAKELAQSGDLILEEKKRPGEYFPVFEGENFTAVLSSKDLCMIDYLTEFKNAGVDSLKVEGRMKSLYYVALTARAYRKAIDAKEGLITEESAKPFVAELFNLQHRAFGTGFYFGPDDANETTSGESSGEYEMSGTIEKPLDAEESKKVLEAGKNTVSNFNAMLESLHPDAKTAKEKDYSDHPEKVPTAPQENEEWYFYPFKAMNKIEEGLPFEFIGPDTVRVPMTNDKYCFVNPIDGTVMKWVSFGHDCLLYTSEKLEENWILRMKTNKIKTAGR